MSKRANYQKSRPAESNRGHNALCSRAQRRCTMSRDVPQIPYSEVTPKHLYLSRREFIAGAGAAAVASGILGEAYAAALQAKPSQYRVDEKLTPKDAVTTYNNFYEFGTEKGAPGLASR